MAINPLSGNFQPPSQNASGKALPNSAENESVRPVEVKQSSTRVVETKAAQAEKPSFDEVASQLQPISQNIQRGLRFQVDDATGDTVISVIDRQTDETIRQIPPEELLNLSKRLKEVSEELDSVRGILIQTDA